LGSNGNHKGYHPKLSQLHNFLVYLSVNLRYLPIQSQNKDIIYTALMRSSSAILILSQPEPTKLSTFGVQSFLWPLSYEKFFQQPVFPYSPASSGCHCHDNHHDLAAQTVRALTRKTVDRTALFIARHAQYGSLGNDIWRIGRSSGILIFQLFFHPAIFYICRS